MFNNILFLIKSIYPRFKNKLILIQVLIFINALLQILTIFSFGPLVILLTNPNKIYDLNLIFLSDLTNEEILIFFTLTIMFLFVISNLSNILVSRVTFTLAQKIGVYISDLIFSNLISKNYNYYVNTNSSDIISKITLETNRVVGSIITPLLLINSRIVLVLIIFIGVLFFDYKASIVILIFALTGYNLIFFFQKKKLSRNSQTISKNNKIRQKIVSESFNNMRQTIMFDVREYFLTLFNKSNKKISIAIYDNQFLSLIPRNIIESFSFIILMIVIIFLKKNNLLISSLPTISVYLVALYKLLPALQGLATYYAALKGNYSALENILPELNFIHNNKNKFLNENNLLEKFESLNLENITFFHKEKKILENSNFVANKGEIIGIFGETGAGKSTIIDLICGLIEQNKGTYYFNKKIITKEIKEKLNKYISLVPQKSTLLDDTIKANVMFGSKETSKIIEELNYLKQICKLDFVDNVNNNWNTIVGEDGSKLSGGQVQRLCIARALYRRPNVLILDESTSALDEKTEQSIISNLKKYKDEMTIIIISHNKKIIEICDKIYELKDFRINKIR